MKRPPHINELSRAVRLSLQQQHHGMGLGVLVGTLLLLSVIAGFNPSERVKIFSIGEVADSDIVAQRSLIVEDSQATKAKQKQVSLLQPNVFDLSVAEISSMRTHLFDILKKINETDSAASQENLLQDLKTQFAESLDMEIVTAWAQPAVQEYILNMALPWMEAQLREGIVGNTRLALASKNGVIIRDLENGLETVRPDGTSIRDISSLLASFNQRLRAEYKLSPQAKKAVFALFSSLVMPTMTLNREATLALGDAVAKSVEPVYYNIQQGEVIVHQGDRITREAHLKLHSLYKQSDGMFHSRQIAGTFVFSLLFSIGLFMAPSGKPGTVLQRKDFYFISFLLFTFGLAAKGAYLIIGRLVPPQDIALAMHFFPVAGAAGLGALIFAARRYCVLGFLLALFSCSILNADLPLFLFFFLSAMLNTWLVIRAQSRQDVVISIIPLSIGLMLISLGSGWLQDFRGAEIFLYLAGISVLNAFTSVIVLFAFSPIIELVFSYTTRFRLMELMNLEQPILQDLMVTIPGTYHHSLVVSNMAEVGAKTVGANSLLCKVAALYHDIGKLAYPDYYIENQFNGPNRHDRLAPAMSALILFSHVKKGIELSREHNLGDEIQDIIAQHHGTSLVKFFYSKAVELGENPRIEDYCYAGPRPQTREAAIVMLADAVEASSRTLSDPTPARISNHVDTIMKGIFSEGQLDESGLTFKDLHKLSENFIRILTGMFHQRIAYPDINRKPRRENGSKAHATPGKTKKSDVSSSLFVPSARSVEPASAKKQSSMGGKDAVGTRSGEEDPGQATYPCQSSLGKAKDFTSRQTVENPILLTPEMQRNVQQ